VFNISYRSPRGTAPAALEDACAALDWVRENAGASAAIRSRRVRRQSAGANLVTALTVATCFERPEPWARKVYGPESCRAVVAACGLLQVSDTRRFAGAGRTCGRSSTIA
jgi:acetyl esterase/lipase